MYFQFLTGDLNFRAQARRALQLSGLLLGLLLSFTQAKAAQVTPTNPLRLTYRLRLLRPTTHIMKVEITAQRVTQPTLDFVMPAWAPGRYAIYDFAKNVQQVHATGEQGQQLSSTKIDKQTWQVKTRGAEGTVHFDYRVFANDLSGTFSQFDTSHANVNGGSVFMYIARHKRDPLTLTVEAPPRWKLISGFSLSLKQRTFQVRDYDLLVDTPMEISPDCILSEFQERGKIFRVAVHSYAGDDKDIPKLVDSLKKIVHSEMAMMPLPDFNHYTFIFHFAPDIEMGDGMEHLNSTQIIVSQSLNAATLPQTLETAAHEFFHLWNVKRLRPVGLGPFDYTHEVYTRSLWFAEGVTSYYSYLTLLRSGLWTREKFLKRLAGEIHDLQVEPGRSLMSAESSSFNAWFFDRSPQMQETNFANTTISYYNKGLLLGMLLDLQIRSRTGGRKSLDDVMNTLYQEFYEQPAKTYYGPGRGYTEKDLLEAVNAVSGSDFGPFFERYVKGTAPLPYASTLALAGLALHAKVKPGSPPSLGILTQLEEDGLRIMAVHPGGAADRAGLSRDDILLTVDDMSVETEGLDERLKIYPPGTTVPITIERHGKEMRVSVTLDPPQPNVYTITQTPNPSPEQLKIQRGWLGTE